LRSLACSNPFPQNASGQLAVYGLAANPPPAIINPNGSTSAMMTSMMAKQRSARLHLFQSDIQSRIQQPPLDPALIDNRWAW
jgi:hypothetical protein